MESLLLNNVLTLDYPEGFHILTAEELDQMNFIQSGPGKCLSDPELPNNS